MSKGSAIEWTDSSWNPIRARRRLDGGKVLLGWHCTHASEGCRHCYAEGFNLRLGTKLPYKPGHERDIEIFLDDKVLIEPLRWVKPQKIFPGSMTDLFADFVTDAMLDSIFAVMAQAHERGLGHIFQVVTKRSARVRAYLADDAARRRGIRAAYDAMGLSECWLPTWPIPSVWLGVSVEDQDAADQRIPDLLATPAAVRFLSCEPLLGPVDLTRVRRFVDINREFINAIAGKMWTDQSGLPNPDPIWSYPGRPFAEGQGGIDWVICGGESGAQARPMHPDWARGLRDQCAEAGVPFFFKQWGEWAPGECAEHAQTRTEAVAWLDDDGWSFDRLTPRVSQEMHRDDGPEVWRFGKKKAGRLLDGVEHSAFPAGAAL